jgi:uncharacterized RDD family membrane protein YckC
MRCPKCQYISFGSAERCRNCGYEFVLASGSVAPLDLPIESDDQTGPLADFVLSEQPPAPISRSPFDANASEAANARRAQSAARLDLPLFGDDAPLVTPPAVPRQPLSVRRGQPALARPRAERADPAEDRTVATNRPAPRVVRLEDGWPLDTSSRADVDSSEEGLRPASSMARAFAGLVDVAVLAAIDTVIVYSTLRLLDLPFARIGDIPVAPMGVFLLLLNGGYLAIFTTAGGQTIGKMLARIKVVSDPSAEAIDLHGSPQQVPLGASVLRATAYLASLLPLGLGFAAILFDSDGRALHDRLAETRVVKA